MSEVALAPNASRRPSDRPAPKPPATPSSAAQAPTTSSVTQGTPSTLTAVPQAPVASGGPALGKKPFSVHLVICFRMFIEAVSGRPTPHRGFAQVPRPLGPPAAEVDMKLI